MRTEEAVEDGESLRKSQRQVRLICWTLLFWDKAKIHFRGEFSNCSAKFLRMFHLLFKSARAFINHKAKHPLGATSS